MNFIDEQIELLNQKHSNNPYVAPQVLNSITDNNNGISDFDTWIQAAGIGAGNMLNNTIFGGLGQILGSIGAGVEYVSPFSGSQADERINLLRLGIPYETAKEIYPDQDSWITSLAKGSLGIQNTISDKINAYRSNIFSDNPDYGTQVAEGTGSSLGFMGAGMGASYLAGLAGLGPLGIILAGALAAGGLEALSESGGTLGEAYRLGKYDEGGLAAANKSFLTNAALNFTLDSGLGFFAPWTAGIRNPITKFAARTAGSVLNELIQEPSQQVIEKSAVESLNNGGNFMTALGHELPHWWETAKQLAPSVAGSSLLTSLITGGAGLANPNIRRTVASQFAHRNESTEQAQTDLQKHYDAIEALKRRIEREKSGNNNQKVIDSLNNRIEKRIHQIQRLTDTYSLYDFNYTPENSQGNGNTADISTADNRYNNVKTQYKLAELDSLITQINQDGTLNPKFPQALRTDERSAPDYLERVNNIAENLDPALLGESPDTLTGAPIVGADSIVEAGNARIMALRQAYSSNPEKAALYRQWLNDNSERLGLDPKELQHMKNPVLVRQRLSDVRNRADFAKSANMSEAPQNTNPEQNSGNNMQNPPRKTRKRNKKVGEKQTPAAPNLDNSQGNNTQNPIILNDNNTEETPLNNTPEEKTNNTPPTTPKITPNPVNKENTQRLPIKPVEPIKRPEGKKVERIDKKTVDTTQSDIDPQRPTGKKVKIITSRGTEVETQYRILEADELIASNSDDGKINPIYPQELQPRDRTNDRDNQIQNIALHPDPERLAENRMASDGAPVIGSDRVVESGNGRIMGLRKSYRLGKADGYRQFLIDNAQRWDLNPDDIAAMKNPILVRERLTPVNRKQFTSEANEASIASMSNTENAYDDARAITPQMLHALDISKPIDENITFVYAFKGTLSQNEKNMMTDKRGRLSKYAYERANYALAALAYGDESIITRLSETQNDDLKSISNGLLKAAPALAVLQDGSFRDDISLRDDIAEAIDWLEHVNHEHSKDPDFTLSEFLAQPGLGFAELRPNIETLLRFFDNHKRNPNDIAQAFINYVQIAQNEAKKGQGSMFEDSVRSKEDILAEALRKVDAEKEGGTIAQISFKKWFGDWQKSPQKASKVVDENGRPLIVYHGTDEESVDGRPPFSEFDTSGSHELTKNTGAWFTSNRKAAKTFGNYIYETYLNIRNPFIFESKNRLKDTRQMDQIVRDVKAGKYGDNYDGVIFRNVEDALHYFEASPDELVSDVFVIFDKTQAKSADMNNGNFDPVQGNMFKQGSVEEDNIQNISINNNDTQNQENSATDENTQSSNEEYDGFIGNLDITEHNGENHSTNIFLDEFNGRPYLDITDENGDSVATFDMRSNTFHIRPDHKNSGWVRNIEGDFRREFGNNPTEEILRRNFRQKAIDAGLDSQVADASSAVYMAGNKFFAKYSGQSLFDVVRSDNLSIRRGKNQGNDNSRGSTTFQEQITDKNGNVIQEAQTIVNLFQKADKSTLLHEIGHIFLDKFKNLAKAGLLKGKALHDWGVIMKQYGLNKIDFSKELTGKDFELWHNAQENFAASIEKYFMKGKNPEGATKKIRNVIKAFKEWLKSIYSSLSRIKYTDAKGVQRKFDLSKDIRAVIDDLISDRTNKPSAVIHDGLSIDNQSFLNPESERRYKEAQNAVKPAGIFARMGQWVRDTARSMRFGDFPELASSKRTDVDLLQAQEALRQLARRKKKAVIDAEESFRKNLKSLNHKQLDLFNRYRILSDLMWQIQEMPESDLAFGFDEESLKKEYERFTPLVEADQAVKNAIQAEEKTLREINEDYIKHASLLGLNMEGVFSNPHYYRHRIIEYAKAARMGRKSHYSKGNIDLQEFADLSTREMLGRSWLKKRKGSQLDFSTDYIQANLEVRAQMLQDIENMKTLLELKEKFDIAPRLRKKPNSGNGQENSQINGENTFRQSDNSETESILDAIPEGYEAFDTSATRLIEGNKSSAENLLNMAAEEFTDKNGIPLDRILHSFGLQNENSLIVIPSELAESLRKLSRSRHRSMLGQTAKELTTWWKRAVLFSPTRNLKYNIRNFTGDIDALIAGNPHALKHFGRAVKELTDYYLHRSNEGYTANQDLQEYIDRAGGLGIESLNMDAKSRQLLIDFTEQVKNGKKKGRNLIQLIKSAFNHEVAFTEWREHLLRYAAYIDYKQQMESNENGKPNNWGASLEKEVMSLTDIRDRAYKMSNELLGAYDQVSEVGKQLRDMLVPFYSWMEVNARRYYRLFKNGVNGKNNSEFVKRLLMGKAAGLPFHALSAADTLGKIFLFTMATQLFNRFVWPDADDDLPRDVKYRPHLTLWGNGKKTVYFDRIGALADLADWFSLDSIALDVKDMANGQLSLGEWAKKIFQAPMSKAVNGLNPMIKIPIELAMGRSMFPNVFHPATIRDPAGYVARSFGLSWPYKAITGEPRDNMQELLNLGVYSLDPDEAAYWQTLDRVRQFQNQVLDRHFDGFASTARGRILQNLKKALRFNDREAVRRFLREYTQADGTKQGLKASMKAMNPLHGLSEKEKAQFMRWISPDDRKYLRKAMRYFHQLADRYIQ